MRRALLPALLLVAAAPQAAPKSRCAVTEDYASVRVSGSRLYLREEGGKAEAVYKRIK